MMNFKDRYNALNAKVVAFTSSNQTMTIIYLFAFFLLLLLIGIMAGCGQQSQTDKVKSQMSKVYPLTADERQAASINAKQYFEKEWAPAGGQRGQFNECRPSDSNANGLVTCFGFIPNPGGGYKETK